MTYRIADTTTQSISKPRAIAIGFAVVLHVAAITAINSGLKISDLPKLPMPSVAEIIEIEKTPPAPPPETKPTFETPVIPWSDPQPFVVEKESKGITQTKPKEVPAEKSAEKIVVAPRVDKKHPLTQPPYPTSSKRAGEAGTVELAIYVLASGKVGEAHVEHSSGFAKLDEAAIKEALRAWRLNPQTVDGVAVAAWHKIAVTFRLEN